MNIWRLVTTALRLWRKEESDRKDKAERATIARPFNNRYTFHKEWATGKDRLPGTAMYGILPRSGYAWMCPECNQIHHPTECSVMDGLHYPACCSTPAGNRLHYGIRT